MVSTKLELPGDAQEQSFTSAKAVQKNFANFRRKYLYRSHWQLVTSN